MHFGVAFTEANKKFTSTEDAKISNTHVHFFNYKVVLSPVKDKGKDDLRACIKWRADLA